jgi:vancomycin permeability regulator SanA
MRRVLRWSLVAVAIVVMLALYPYAWVRLTATGHLYNEVDLAGGKGPHADVVLVLGAEVAPDRTDPMPYLRGRLDTAAQLYRDGNVAVVLVSGDAGGASGNEPEVMTRYLVALGVDPARIVPDPYGLDTYDSCRRARDVYGLRRLLVVTQPYHLGRAVTLCRELGIDADGVGARCGDCSFPRLLLLCTRDYFASTKAATDVITDRPPAVASPPSNAVAVALATPVTGSARR